MGDEQLVKESISDLLGTADADEQKKVVEALLRAANAPIVR